LSENKEMNMKGRIWAKGTRITANTRAKKTGIVFGDRNESYKNAGKRNRQ